MNPQDLRRNQTFIPNKVYVVRESGRAWHEIYGASVPHIRDETINVSHKIKAFWNCQTQTLDSEMPDV